jgi:hypothetical protein
MKTAMQELRDDLVKSLETGNEALNEITDEKLREICQKVAQLTLESIIKRIDEELLEMEKEQKGFSEEQVKQAITNFYMNDMLLTPANLEKVIKNIKNKEQ